MAMAAQAKVLSGSKLEQLVVRLQRHSGRPKEACWRFIIQYGIKGQQDHRRWTESEFEIVREELVKRSIDEVAKKVNRTPKAIRNMLKRNNLSLREIRCDLFSVEGLASALRVRKTLAARWLASRLDRPLIVLDLAAVMSSFLGRTGNNVRNVIDYAKGVRCVFLLDEFDAIAKRRDDAIEIGELKRLVTVLLQEIDDWPSSGLLIAATNHKELLDPAVWRRFEMIIDFPMPTLDEVKQTIELHLKNDPDAMHWSGMLARALDGLLYAEVERELMQIRRQAVLRRQPASIPIRRMVLDKIRNLDRQGRTQFALKLLEAGLSQRETHEWTGVSRDTIRKAVREEGLVS
jgi:hypothetical protein